MCRHSLWRAGILPTILMAVAAGQEEKLAPDKAPKPVMEAVRARFKDAEIKGVSKETEDGKRVYEVTINHRGRNIDVTLTPGGELLMIEREITARELPRAVVRTLENKYPKAAYKILEEIIKVEKKKEKPAYYEALLVTADGKTLEVQVTAEGRVVSEENKGPAPNGDQGTR